MTIGMRPICMYCLHLRHGLTCDAYPKGIPEGILTNKVSHLLPQKDDNGIQFQPKSTQDEKDAREVLASARL